MGRRGWSNKGNRLWLRMVTTRGLLICRKIRQLNDFFAVPGGQVIDIARMGRRHRFCSCGAGFLWMILLRIIYVLIGGENGWALIRVFRGY